MSEPVERTYRVELMTRVEGEGRFTLRVKDGVVLDAKLELFEAPRYFEALVQRRSAQEAIDIVSRICGICPVAYQLTACRALEQALGVQPTEPIEALRRLLYCGEWIESHALHVFLLHAPDFLGYPSAIEMAAEHRALVEQGLRLKKAGNAIVAALGGRAVHPVSARVGGFTKVPTRRELQALAPQLRAALDDGLEALRWAARLPAEGPARDYVFVALGGERYPLGASGASSATPGECRTTTPGESAATTREPVLVSGREAVPVEAWPEAIVETSAPHSSALFARLLDGTPYLCGPAARLHHHAERLRPEAAEAMREVGLPRTVREPERWIAVRALEIVHALAEALERVAQYDEPDLAFVETPAPRASVGVGATEAPRGLLWHRYELAGGGLIARARILPPTSQNQARIEADLRDLGPQLTQLEHAEGTRLAERLIRCFDPCISCATHFLDLRVERSEPERGSEGRRGSP